MYILHVCYSLFLHDGLQNILLMKKSIVMQGKTMLDNYYYLIDENRYILYM